MNNPIEDWCSLVNFHVTNVVTHIDHSYAPVSIFTAPPSLQDLNMENTATVDVQLIGVAPLSWRFLGYQEILIPAIRNEVMVTNLTMTHNAQFINITVNLRLDYRFYSENILEIIANEAIEKHLLR